MFDGIPRYPGIQYPASYIRCLTVYLVIPEYPVSGIIYQMFDGIPRYPGVLYPVSGPKRERLYVSWSSLFLKTRIIVSNSRHFLCNVISLRLMYVQSSNTFNTERISKTWRLYEYKQLFLYQRRIVHMMTSSNGNIFRVTGHLCGEFTGPRWLPHTKASDAELWCFLWSASE